MAKPQQTTAIPKKRPAAPQKEHNDDSLKGTFASVMIVGAFILVMWLGVFVLFLSRN